jgi:hypothetical protein
LQSFYDRMSLIVRRPHPPRILASLAIVLSIVQATTFGVLASADIIASTTTTASAFVHRRTALDLSTSVLQFHVTDASQQADASVTFGAAARTTTNGEVLLVMRVPSEMPGMTLTVVGGTEEAVSGVVTRGDTTVVGRWVGGGRRTGHLQFKLRAAPGVYSIPVSFRVDAL